MKNKYIYITLAIVVIGIIVFSLSKRKSLKPGLVSKERKKTLAEQYKAQLDGIFALAAKEMRKLTSEEQIEVNRLQEKLIQLGYVYELPVGYNNGDYVFTPATMRIQAYLN